MLTISEISCIAGKSREHCPLGEPSDRLISVPTALPAASPAEGARQLFIYFVLAHVKRTMVLEVGLLIYRERKGSQNHFWGSQIKLGPDGRLVQVSQGVKEEQTVTIWIDQTFNRPARRHTRQMNGVATATPAQNNQEPRLVLCAPVLAGLHPHRRGLT
ncbi:hypothetical protein CEXT_360011 [Caerostris extrusa]|uniref:Uncharacterized protein n=1 Tax=Caerostris extrusa TaxID=172846 RepID=A0AAV4YCW7_CAEEX|nr:hypothetical protein CEXT_360011 [Caerostris extrusa]